MLSKQRISSPIENAYRMNGCCWHILSHWRIVYHCNAIRNIKIVTRNITNVFTGQTKARIDVIKVLQNYADRYGGGKRCMWGWIREAEEGRLVVVVVYYWWWWWKMRIEFGVWKWAISLKWRPDFH
jgi:hypothetical protein